MIVLANNVNLATIFLFRLRGDRLFSLSLLRDYKKCKGKQQPLPLRLVLCTITLLLFLSACGGQEGEIQPTPTATQNAVDINPDAKPTATPTPAPTTVELQTTVIARNLDIPWSVVFLPDGRALFTERNSGRLRALDENGQISDIQTLPKGGGGEGGLLGLAISPDYDTDQLVYTYYTTDFDNRVARFRLGEEPEVILSDLPAAGNHNGGRIAFGPDGKLYIGTGDAANTSNSQNRDSLGGKILRMNPDGTTPNDNPFPGSLVYSYGHRNVQGLAWDKLGQLYATEFGQNTFDEVNRIEPGGNYGWPNVEGTGNDPQYINPIATFATSEASPSGAAILVNGAIPQWEGQFFMASLRGECLWRLKLDKDGNVVEREALLLNEYGRLRHVAQAPDGSLWILTSNQDGRGSPTGDDDRIIRIGPA